LWIKNRTLAVLFDYLIGGIQQAERYGKTERFRSFDNPVQNTGKFGGGVAVPRELCHELAISIRQTFLTAPKSAKHNLLNCKTGKP
jgi:hypothetical protein